MLCVQTKLLPTKSSFWEVPGKQKLAGEDNPTSQYLKKISPDNQSRETTLKPGICSQVCHKSLLSWENQLLMENKIVIQKLQA